MLEAVALGGNGLHDYRLGEWVCECGAANVMVNILPPHGVVS